MGNLELKKLRKAGIFPVTVDAPERHTAPYSGKECLWYDSLCVSEGFQETGVHTKLERSRDEILYFRTDQGILELLPRALNPHLRPSFSGNRKIKNEVACVEEYIILADRQYYAKVSLFRAHLPPLFCIPRTSKIYLLDLYDEHPRKGGAEIPLIPTFRGRTG